MFKCHHGFVPELFTNVFTSIQAIHNHNTRQNNQLYCPNIYTNLGTTKFSYRGPFIWNKIIENGIDKNTSESVFSRALQSKLMNDEI